MKRLPPIIPGARFAGFACAALLTVSTACARSASTGDGATIVRLDTIPIQTILTADSIRPAIDAMAVIGLTEGTDSASLAAYAASRAVKFFAPDVKERFSPTASTLAEIDSMSRRVTALLAGERMPVIYGVISPYNQSIMTASDSVMIIALNHYLGPDYIPYSAFEPYVRRQKDAALLPAHIAEALVQRLRPMEDGDVPTPLWMLMLRDGAVAEAVTMLAPGTGDAAAGGWTLSELRDLEALAPAIRAELRKKKMLDSTDPLTAARMLAPAPATLALDFAAPGRAGRFIGLMAVRKYRQAHPDATLDFLLSPSFYSSPEARALLLQD